MDYQSPHQILYYHGWYYNTLRTNGMVDEKQEKLRSLQRHLQQTYDDLAIHWGLQDAVANLSLPWHTPRGRQSQRVAPGGITHRLRTLPQGVPGSSAQIPAWRTCRPAQGLFPVALLLHILQAYCHNEYWSQCQAMGRGPYCQHVCPLLPQPPSSGKGAVWLSPWLRPWCLHHRDYEGWCSCKWNIGYCFCTYELSHPVPRRTISDFQHSIPAFAIYIPHREVQVCSWLQTEKHPIHMLGRGWWRFAGHDRSLPQDDGRWFAKASRM